MLVRPAFFRSVRLLVLLCLLLVLPTMVSRAEPSAGAAEVDITFQPELLMSSTISHFVAQPDGKVIVAGDFTSASDVSGARLARLNIDGTLDPSFATVSISPAYVGNNQTPAALALQADGKLLIGGNFNQVNGVSRRSLARLNADGTLDASFTAAPDSCCEVRKILVQPDGKIIVGGSFNKFNGVTRPGLARLNADGTVDPTFVPPFASSTSQDLALQPDGKLLIGGSLYLSSTVRLHLARLNTDGTLDTSFAPSLNQSGEIEDFGLQPDGKLVIAGRFTTVNDVPRENLARLNADGTLDPAFVPGASTTYRISAVIVRPNGKMIVSGYTSFSSPLFARLNADGTTDSAFALAPNSIGRVDMLGQQADGKLLLAGSFSAIDHVSRTGLARLNADDSLDASFVPFLNKAGQVWTVGQQADGKLLLGGSFTSINGIYRPGVARLNLDGSVDPTFDPESNLEIYPRKLIVQPDGKIVLSGSFFANYVRRDGLMRLNPDGSLDAGFAPIIDQRNPVEDLVRQPDGKLVIVGYFTSVNGVSRPGIARLNPDGSLDMSFNGSTAGYNNASKLTLQANGKLLVYIDSFGETVTLMRLNPDGSPDTGFATPQLNPYSGYLRSIVEQPDGKILIGGAFYSINGMYREHIVRLNADGSLDLSFETNTYTDAIHELMLQPDGKILVAGLSAKLWRLNPDGSTDPSFYVDADSIQTLTRQADGKLILGGHFSTVNGVSRVNIARLYNPSQPPRLFLDPPTTTIGQGQLFQLNLQVDTAGRVADTVDAYLTFDPAVLEVVDADGNPATSIVPNPAVVGSVTHNQVNPATGQIDFSASAYTSPYLTGQATIATIRLRAKATISSSPVQLVRSGIRQSDLFRSGTPRQTTLGHATVQSVNGAVVCGQIAVEQRGPAGTPRWMTPLFRTNSSLTSGGVTLYQPGTTNEVARLAATTDANGRFCAVALGVPVGVYDVQVKGANTLSNQRNGVNLASTTTIDFGTLRVGDATGDDGVTGADVSYMIPSFFLGSGDAGFRPYADTNQDGEISGADVSALIPNFLTGGPHLVTGATVAQAVSPRTAAAASAQITLTPALKQLHVGEVAALDVQLHLEEL
ncbi:MAG TPA: cohesin domain-containing protein, partial [Herpetosiphonaceae bacterium]